MSTLDDTASAELVKALRILEDKLERLGIGEELTAELTGLKESISHKLYKKGLQIKL